jgi:hypothetical protein
MVSQQKDDKAAEHQRWIAEGVEPAISHLERSDFVKKTTFAYFANCL